MARTHHLCEEQVHPTWDVDNEPVLTIQSADTAGIEMLDRAVDSKISEFVDSGQYIVSALLPEAIITGSAPSRNGSATGSSRIPAVA